MQFGDRDPDVGDQLRSLETAVLALTKLRGSNTPLGQQRKLTGEICKKLNAAGFPFSQYMFLTVCSGCGGGHSISRCGIRGARLIPAMNRPGSHSY